MANILDWISFVEFRERVGRTDYKVRQALAALQLRPQVSPTDQRKLVYDPDWIEKVRIWIDTGGIRS
jgi:hypothetical protein